MSDTGTNGQGRVALVSSERKPVPGSRRVGDAVSDERVLVTELSGADQVRGSRSSNRRPTGQTGQPGGASNEPGSPNKAARPRRSRGRGRVGTSCRL